MNAATELGRAYRAIRGFWTAAQKGEAPDKTMLAYHSPTIAAACRFVTTGKLDGTEYFVGKPVEVMHEALEYMDGSVVKPATGPTHQEKDFIAATFSELRKSADFWSSAAWDQGLRAEGLDKENAGIRATVEQLLAALMRARQLATIAIDWNLEEVEIDGDMVVTRELRDEFDAAIAKCDMSRLWTLERVS